MPYPSQNPVACALREIGRVERTLFMLDWLGDADLRRRTNANLNKGEARNALARAVFFIAAFAEIHKGLFSAAVILHDSRFTIVFGTAERMANGRDLCQRSRKRIAGHIQQCGRSSGSIQ